MSSAVRLGRRPERLALIDASAHAMTQAGLDGGNYRRRALTQVGEATDRSNIGRR